MTILNVENVVDLTILCISVVVYSVMNVRIHSVDHNSHNVLMRSVLHYDLCHDILFYREYVMIVWAFIVFRIEFCNKKFRYTILNDKTY